MTGPPPNFEDVFLNEAYNNATAISEDNIIKEVTKESSLFENADTN